MMGANPLVTDRAICVCLSIHWDNGNQIISVIAGGTPQILMLP